MVEKQYATNSDKDQQLLEEAGVGFAMLQKGYVSYARETIINRSIPNIYDGLKPVQRFILQILNKRKRILHKSAPIVAGAMELHAHGDGSIYEALTRMTDNNGTMNYPMIKGRGNFSANFSTKPAAAMRYTEVTQIPYNNEYFTMIDGVKTVLTEDGKFEYLQLLPVSFPGALVNEANGMGVGIATRIPSFNLKDVINLVEEYINTGKMETIIAPDFSTGGQIVNDQKVFAKLMTKGQGQLKLRAKLDISGKTITVSELPFGVSVESLKRKLDDLQLDNISSAENMSDLKNGLQFIIEVSDASKMDQTLLELYKYTDLQKSYSANMIFVENDHPIQSGVYNVIDKWVKWRRGVILKQLTTDMFGIQARMKYVKAFKVLIDNTELRDKVVDTITHKDSDAAIKLIIENIEETDEKVAKWILNRRISQFRDGGKYAREYATLVQEYKHIKERYDNPSLVILEDMQRLRNTEGLNADRRTQLTNTDFNFVKKEEEREVDTTNCEFIISSTGFIKKLPIVTGNLKDGEISVEAEASDTIIAIDNQGRLYRVYADDIPYNQGSDLGTYIPRYAKQPEETTILWAGVAKPDKKYLLIFNDGYASVLDSSPFSRELVNQRSRLMVHGVNDNVYDKLLDIVEITPEIASSYLAIEDSSTRNLKLGLIKIKDIEEKSRTSRSKVMNARLTSNFGIFTVDELEQQDFEIADFETSKAKRKMEVYEGPFPEHVEPIDEDSEGTLKVEDAKAAFNKLFGNI